MPEPMLFNSITQATILESIKKAKDNITATFTKSLKKIEDFFNGHQDASTDSSYYPAFEGESQTQYDQRKKDFVYINIVEHIAQTLCASYNKTIDREIYQVDHAGEKDLDSEQKPVKDELIDEVERGWTDDNYENDLGKADETAFLGYGAFCGIHWNKEKSITDLSWWLYRNIAFIQDTIDPRKITHLITMHATSETANKGDNVEMVYTDEWWSQIINDKYTDGSFHNYGIIPFVHIRNDYEWDGVWGKGKGEFLAEANQKINEKLSAIHALGQDQSYTQLVYIGCAPDETVGRNRPIVVENLGDYPERVDVKTLQIHGEIEKLLVDLKDYIDMIYAKFGMVNRSIMRVDTGNPESGIAKYLEDYHVFKQNEKFAKLRAKDEEKIARMRMLVYSKEKKIDYNPDGYIIVIKYASPSPILDPQSEANLLQTYTDLGITNAAKIAMEKHPNLMDEETAEDFVIKNLVTTDRIRKEAARQIAEADRQAAQERMGQPGQATPPPINEELA